MPSTPPGYGPPGYAAPGTVGVPPAPPGFAYGAQALKPTKGLRTATIVLMWLVTAAFALIAVAYLSRRSVVNGFFDGNKSITDVDDADNFVGGAALLAFSAMLACVIVLCIWSHRVVSNGRARGVPNLSPGLAAGGWYIPIGMWWLSFVQIRRAMRGVGAATAAVGAWQGLFIAANTLGGISLSYGSEDAMSSDEIKDVVTNQSILGVMTFILYVVLTIFAMRAIKQADAALGR
jgi:hypothetical protein